MIYEKKCSTVNRYRTSGTQSLSSLDTASTFIKYVKTPPSLDTPPSFLKFKKNPSQPQHSACTFLRLRKNAFQPCHCLYTPKIQAKLVEPHCSLYILKFRKSPIYPRHSASTFITFFITTFSFWAADLKGTMSYRTEGGISVRPSERVSVRTSVRPNVRPNVRPVP